MNENEQRIAIAEACGFIIADYRMEDGSVNVAALPDYLNDLNAMHEAEKGLTWSHHLTFRKKLWDLVIELGTDDTWYWRFVSAASRQRAEAFLKTLNLWKP